MERHSDEKTRKDNVGEVAGERRAIALWEGGSAACPLPDSGRVTIGRALDCDLVVDHFSVSRLHAILHVGAEMRIEDCGSSNGTSVGGRKLEPRAVARIESGQPINIGRAVVVVQAGASSPSSERPHAGSQAAVNVASADGPMAQLEQMISLVAASHLSVLVQGETGAGKERVASRIHALSDRKSGPFVRLNCAAFPETLLESELFGFERGAFTGAAQAKPGLLETAHGGTVFLDELAEMTMGTQAKLLRAVESREVTRLGSTTAKTIDVRFVCATHQDLRKLSDAGGFRQDLYFRLNGITLFVPPLRERRGEIAPLAMVFAGETAQRLGIATPTILPDTFGALLAYRWPGNIRELRNVIERAVVLSRGAPVGLEHLPPEIVEREPDVRASEPPTDQERFSALRSEFETLERERIERALADAAGNQTKAAQILGMSRRTLVKRLDSYSLPRPRKGR